ncbi:MAG: zinc-dependent dehydrogenase [Thermoplasmata archaeon]|nr:zinc-dependent dehydrogenase [Thermoplasmata archaeon]
MKVAMYYNNSDVRVEEMPVPEIGDDELLVKVMACGICGSDVMEWYRIKKAPRVLGHEMVGEIVKVGEKVKNFSEGDRVFVSHHVPCGECRYCLNGQETLCDTLRSTNFYPGGFSQYLRVPAINVEKGTFLLPQNMSYEQAVFIEPLGCVVRGLRIAEFKKGQSILIIGSGITGLLHVKLAKAMGASRIITTDINPFRLEKAREYGAHATLLANDPNLEKKIREANNGMLPDFISICTGAPPAFKQAFELIGRGGTILLFAPAEPGVEIPFPIIDLWHDGVTIKSTYAASPSDLQKAIDLIASGKIKVEDMITHRLSIDKAGEGFQLVAEAKDSIKVIIEPWR